MIGSRVASPPTPPGPPLPAAILEHFFNTVSTLITLVLSFTLLYRTIGLAAIAPIVVTLGLSIIDVVAVLVVVRNLQRLMFTRDARIKLMHEFVKGIRTIKAGGITAHFATEVKSIRQSELGLLS